MGKFTEELWVKKRLLMISEMATNEKGCRLLKIIENENIYVMFL